ncbi:MAG: hypothetical protein KW788_02475 [Candidatus Doudnabacteria bacterium]|nr:hypothetical protein [Candidatus Doudnabacteria bacterium]
MLIATLPTLKSAADLKLCEEIFSQSLIGAARYNTGGESPYKPAEIVSKLKSISDRYNKTLYIDLEGRQTRVAVWTPFSRNCVQLNRDFCIKLPGMIYFRRAGWCEIVNADPATRCIFFASQTRGSEYYLGSGQSVHIVAEKFEVKGYLGGLDEAFIAAAASLGVTRFMLSFVESLEDIAEFEESYRVSVPNTPTDAILKIESPKGLSMIKKFRTIIQGRFRLMAARDDLFLGYLGRRGEILSALKQITSIDSEAIVASRLLAGLERGQEITLADIEDVALMTRFGYKHFMFADELADKIALVSKIWQKQILPNLESE